VQTAGRPLIECGCQENSSFSSAFFSPKAENHLLGKKISQKILRRAFLIYYFLGCAASILKKLAVPAAGAEGEPCRTPQGPLLTNKRHASRDAASSRHLPMGDIPAMSALPPKADIRERVLDVRFGP